MTFLRPCALLCSVYSLTIASALGAAVNPLSRLPLSFEPNQGRYIARAAGYGVALSSNGAVLSLSGGQPSAVVRLQLLGARTDAPATAEDRQQGVSNYLRGSNPALWSTGIPHFGRVRYRGVYPGIDVVYYGRGRELEYDFVLQPGADPDRIRLAFDGVQHLRLDTAGGLYRPGSGTFQGRAFSGQTGDFPVGQPVVLNNAIVGVNTLGNY